MTNLMHCITFTAPEQAELISRDRESKPLGPREVTGRTIRTLISPGTELAGYQGQWQNQRWPVSPGYAAVFQVDEAGAEVQDLQSGDLAFCMGSHQSFQRALREDVVPVPKGLAADIAVFARLMCVTMSTLTTTTARPPQLVLVAGLGLVGHLAARVFDACGYEVIACDPAEVRREIALRSGIRTVLPAVPIDDPAVAGRVALALECSGHEQAALDACNVVCKRGEVVIVAAMWKRRTDITAYELLQTVFSRYVVLRSGWEWEVPLTPTDFKTSSMFGNCAGAMKWLVERRIPVDNLAPTVSPHDVQAAYQNLLHQPGTELSYILDWTSLSLTESR